MNLSDQFLFLLALLILIALGYLVSRLLLPLQLGRSLAWAFAPATGAGICSLIYFLFRRPFFTVEITLLAVFSVIWFFSRWKHKSEKSARRAWTSSIVGLLCLAMLLPITYGLLQRADKEPHGGWDAWAIWNSHARVLYRDGANWKSNIQYTIHGDYPLLTPSLTARLWRYAGKEATEGNVLICIMFTVSAAAVLISTLAKLRGGTVALGMGLVLMTTPFYLECGVAQTADVPLSLFFLCAIALIVLNCEREPAQPRLLFLAGFMAGCAGWTKNEGLLFILATCIGVLLVFLPNFAKSRRHLASFAIGVILPLIVIMLFKLTIAPVNDLIFRLHYHEVVPKILSVERHKVILQSFIKGFWTFGAWKVQPIIPLAAFIALIGIDRTMLRRKYWLACFLILVIVLAGYYAVYLAISWPLQDHINSSLARLLIQLWPSFLLILGLAIKDVPSPKRELILSQHV